MGVVCRRAAWCECTRAIQRGYLQVTSGNSRWHAMPDCLRASRQETMPGPSINPDLPGCEPDTTRVACQVTPWHAAAITQRSGVPPGAWAK